ncbi:MAG: IPT/TIG domain-containing protein, partial [Planctomycetes bacterium]|nr:IPT/TIG domain-containing protein [Planctomycetota bacterium]
RYVLFTSDATNLVPNDTNGVADIFHHDRLTQRTTRVNVTSSGEQANGSSWIPAISSDGLHVAFYSGATNLVPGDTNGFNDAFVHDVVTGETSRVNVSLGGDQANDTVHGLFLTTCLSADGRFVCFSTRATNLSSEAPVRGEGAFVHDRISGETTFVSSCSVLGRCDVESAYPAAVSSDGRSIIFNAFFSNYASDLFLYDHFTGTGRRLPATGGSADLGASMSDDGRFIAFESSSTDIVPGDLNGSEDWFVFDQMRETVSRVSLTPEGGQGSGHFRSARVSADGRSFGFATNGEEFTGNRSWYYVNFVRDLQLGRTVRRGSADNVGGLSSNGACTLAYTTNHSLVSEDTNDYLLDVYTDDYSSFESVAPASGSEAGGDVVTLFGSCFSPASAPVVRFADREATVLATTEDRVRVLTPPGHGTVDVSIVGAWGDGVVAGGFSYVPRELAARYGDVNTGRGDREDVLLVNALSGDPATREVSLRSRDAISIVLVAPSSRASAKYALYAWRGIPNDATLALLPNRVGAMVFPPPFVDPQRHPIAVWNDLGHQRLLGAPTLASRPAPTIVADRRASASSPANITLQGLIEDDASPDPLGISVTNALILRIR